MSIKLRLVPRVKVYYSWEELIAAINILNKEANVKKFEEEFSKKFKNNFAIFFPYGRVALYSFFKALGISQKEVICPAFTCNTVAQAIVLSGNRPVFIDCDKNSFNMDIYQIERFISEDTAAIIAAHMFGYPLDVLTLKEIIDYYQSKLGKKIFIIQDVAQSFGATWKGHLPTKYGDISIFGLGISKIINSISGGMLTTDNYKIYKKIKNYFYKISERCTTKDSFVKFMKFLLYFVLLREHVFWLVDFLEKKNIVSSHMKYYKGDILGFPHDWRKIPCDVQCRVGLVQLKKYDKIITIKRNNAKFWMKETSNTDIYFLPYNPEATYSRCIGLSKNRDYWIKYFYQKGFQLGKVDYLLPEMKAFSKFSKGEYPNAKRYNQQNIIFPS